VVRYHAPFYQSAEEQAPAQAKVPVCEGRYGRMAIGYRGRELRFAEISVPARPGQQEVKRSEEQRRAMLASDRQR